MKEVEGCVELCRSYGDGFRKVVNLVVIPTRALHHMYVIGVG